RAISGGPTDLFLTRKSKLVQKSMPSCPLRGFEAPGTRENKYMPATASRAYPHSLELSPGMSRTALPTMDRRAGDMRGTRGREPLLAGARRRDSGRPAEQKVKCRYSGATARNVNCAEGSG